MLSSYIDSLLARYSSRKRKAMPAGLPTRFVDTPAGAVRVFDSAAGKPCVVFVPDGPNVIEHYGRLIELLAPHVRVVCFDMPGFGHSLPSRRYRHSLDQGAAAVLGVLDTLDIQSATLAFSCANGFYALRAAQTAPGRISGLVLAQTPSLDAMHRWVERIIPRPITIPVAGQIAAWLFRRKAASSWYRAALPKTTPAQPYSLSIIAPHADVVRFPDCGHFPDVEQPERYAALLLERVAKTARPQLVKS